VTQVIQNFAFQIHFNLVTLANLVQFIDDITQIRADFLNFFVALGCVIGNNSFALTRIFEFDALCEKLAFIFAEVNLQNVVVGFLTQAVAVNVVRVTDT